MTVESSSYFLSSSLTPQHRAFEIQGTPTTPEISGCKLRSLGFHSPTPICFKSLSSTLLPVCFRVSLLKPNSRKQGTKGATREPRFLSPSFDIQDPVLISLVAEWIHFKLLGIIVPTIKLKV